VDVGVGIAPAPKQPAYACVTPGNVNRSGQGEDTGHGWIEAGKRLLLLDQGDLGERAGGADEARDGEAEPGAVEGQPRELGGGEQDVGFHVAGHPCSVQLRAQLDEQGKHPYF
jgi:hypothetical protein